MDWLLKRGVGRACVTHSIAPRQILALAERVEALTASCETEVARAKDRYAEVKAAEAAEAAAAEAAAQAAAAAEAEARAAAARAEAERAAQETARVEAEKEANRRLAAELEAKKVAEVRQCSLLPCPLCSTRAV